MRELSISENYKRSINCMFIAHPIVVGSPGHDESLLGAERGQLHVLTGSCGGMMKRPMFGSEAASHTESIGLPTAKKSGYRTRES